MLDRVCRQIYNWGHCDITKLRSSNTPCSDHCSDERHHPNVLFVTWFQALSEDLKQLYTDGQHQIHSNITFQCLHTTEATESGRLIDCDWFVWNILAGSCVVHGATGLCCSPPHVVTLTLVRSPPAISVGSSEGGFCFLTTNYNIKSKCLWFPCFFSYLHTKNTTYLFFLIYIYIDIS